MKFLWLTIAAAMLGACLEAAPARSASDSAFVLFDARTEAQGTEILESLDPALSEDARRLLQVKSVMGDGHGVMIRFEGTCRDNSAFVAEVRRVLERRGATNVRCLAQLPGDE
jgi:hypothetical protein